MKQGINKRTHTRFKINLPESSERDLLCSSFFTGKFSLPLKSFTPRSSSLSVPEKCPSLLTPLLSFSTGPTFLPFSFFSFLPLFVSSSASHPRVHCSSRQQEWSLWPLAQSASLPLSICTSHADDIQTPLGVPYPSNKINENSQKKQTPPGLHH